MLTSEPTVCFKSSFFPRYRQDLTKTLRQVWYGIVCWQLGSGSGVQGECKGGANSEREGEDLLMTGQCVAEIHALGDQREVHHSHFLGFSESRKLRSRPEIHVASLVDLIPSFGGALVTNKHPVQIRKR